MKNQSTMTKGKNYEKQTIEISRIGLSTDIRWFTTPSNLTIRNELDVLKF